MKKVLLFGNEAIVQGALEAGAGFATTYPGTPASEIGDIFAKIAKKQKIYFEYSTNEKVALEAAAGAAFSNVKSIVSMKHYGLNVASDSFLPLVYFSCPLVVVVADDPGCWSSVQTEQDCRWYSRLANIPMLEPSNSQEAKDMTKEAFAIAWKYKIPVLVRLTTRVSHSKSAVKVGKILSAKTRGKFNKKFGLGSTITVERHVKLLEKLEKIKEVVEKSKFNFAQKDNNKGKIGVITSGIAYSYVREALKELNAKLPLLKLGFTYPFPSEKVRKFLSKIMEVFVVEELDPVVEEETRKLTDKKVYGKNLLPEAGELKPEDVLIALSKLLRKKLPINLIKEFSETVPKRIPFLCPGCPHRPVFYVVKKVLGKKIFAGDIGCYMLGSYPPYELENFVVAMGAGTGISHGIAKTTGEKPVIFIGDSTFFHAGIPALLNLVYNKSNALVIVMDNRITAMTGHQPHPGTGFTGMREKTKSIQIEDIAKACQADFVKTSNAYNLEQLKKDIKQAYDSKGVSVIIAKGECRLLTIRKITRQGIPVQKFEIVKQKPGLKELEQFGCPAIRKKKGKYFIDEDLCWGCSLCKQLFPDCIRIKKQEEE